MTFVEFAALRGWVSDRSNGAEIHWYDNSEAKGFTDPGKKAWGDRATAQERHQAEMHRHAERSAAARLSPCKRVEHLPLRSTLPPGVRGQVKSSRASVVSGRITEIFVTKSIVTIPAPAQRARR